MTNKSISLFFIVLLFMAVPSASAEIISMSMNRTGNDNLGIVKGTVIGVEFNKIYTSFGKFYPVKDNIKKIEIGAKIKLQCFGFDATKWHVQQYDSDIKYCKLLKVQKQ